MNDQIVLTYALLTPQDGQYKRGTEVVFGREYGDPEYRFETEKEGLDRLKEYLSSSFSKVEEMANSERYGDFGVILRVTRMNLGNDGSLADSEGEVYLLSVYFERWQWVDPEKLLQWADNQGYYGKG